MASYDQSKLTRAFDEAMVHHDVTSSDEEFFFEFLHASVLSQLFSLLETLLQEVAEDVASMTGISFPKSEEKLPHVNRYIRYLTHLYGLIIEIDKDTWKNLDAIREVRNKYIHKLSRDLPENIKLHLRTICKLAGDQIIIDRNLINSAFGTVAKIVENVETAYWKFIDELPKPTKP